MAALRAHAKGLFKDEAATQLLIEYGVWLYREDFLEIAVEFDRSVVDGAMLAAVDWQAAVTALEAGQLPCAASDAQMLRIAASIADGVRVDLGSVVSGLDEFNLMLVVEAVARAGGARELSVPVPAGAGFYGRGQR